MEPDFQDDIATVQRIAALPSMLDAVCHASGMGLSVVARVTDRSWIACGVADKIQFGLKAGSELNSRTTICHQVLQNRHGVIIDDVANDAVFCTHPAPSLYGFQSCITVPIMLPDNEFFGTLCAIDLKPHRLDTPRITGMFKLFAEMIGVHISAIRRLDEAVERFMPRPVSTPQAPLDELVEHLLLARSLAAGDELDSTRQAVEIALHLIERNTWFN